MLPAGPECAAWRQASHPCQAPGAGGAAGVPAEFRGCRYLWPSVGPNVMIVWPKVG